MLETCHITSKQRDIIIQTRNQTKDAYSFDNHPYLLLKQPHMLLLIYAFAWSEFLVKNKENNTKNFLAFFGSTK